MRSSFFKESKMPQEYYVKLRKLEELIGQVEDQLWSIRNDLPNNQKKEFTQIFDLTHKVFQTAADHHGLKHNMSYQLQKSNREK